MTNSVRARRLALSIIDGEWSPTALTERLHQALQKREVDSKRLAARLLFRYEKPPASFKVLASDLLHEPLLQKFWQEANDSDVTGIGLQSPVMQTPPKQLITLALPRLETTTEVARWLALHPHELNWMADVEASQAAVSENKRHHYHYRWIEKKHTGQRLLEIPKSQLKRAQRQILREILHKLLPHDSAHGFIRSRSCLSYVTPHIGKPVLLHLDLQDFFPSVPVNRIFMLFRTLGYPAAVARTLMGLCTNAVSPALAGPCFSSLDWYQRKQLQYKHLPQGAPTSGALANLCAYRLDCRLSGLAEKYGLRYTRYADDLLFSGPDDLRQRARWLESLVGAIALDEGFALNFRKTRVRTRSQSQRVTGLVINEKPNISRRDFDELKAILTNCLRYGPASQNHQQHSNYQAHIAGRLAHLGFINPQRGAKLQRIFDAICWDCES